MTKDERLLTEIHRALQTAETVDPYLVGEKLGYREKLIKNIVQGLMQANLLKRYSPHEVMLTERGLDVAASLLKS